MTKIMLVGGAVRDAHLGIEAKDRDFVVVGATAEEMVNRGFKPVGKEFPVFLHPETGDEHALARTERKVGHGYGGFEFFASPEVSIEEDLIRRDFTMNAIAFDESSESYIDPYNGREDIKNRIIRHVSPAFVEDPLRVLRAARFYARYSHLGFEIAPETLELMGQISKSGELEHLKAERVWTEIKSAFETHAPEKFFECLHDVGALKVFLPELDALWGIPQPEAHHPEIDCGIHTMLSLKVAKSLTNDIDTLFGVLLHDLGKGVTEKSKLPQHIDHERAGVPLVKAVCQRLRVPNSTASFAEIFCEEHLRIHRSMEMSPKKLLELHTKLGVKRAPQRLVEFCIAGESDARGRLGLENKPYPQAGYLLSVARVLKNMNLSEFNMATERGRQDAHKARLNAVAKHKAEYQP